MPEDPKLVEYYTADRVDDYENRTNQLADLVADRDDWPRLAVVLNSRGSYDVAVIIDSGYDLQGARQMLEHHARHAAKLAEQAKATPAPVTRIGEGSRDDDS